MIMKLLCAAIVLIPTLIAVLLFYLAHALFAVPGVLLGAVQPTIAMLCIVAGILLLLPAVIVLVITLLNLVSRKKAKEPKEKSQ